MNKALIRTEEKQNYDHIRKKILNYLFERNKNSKSLFGKKTGAAITIQVLRRDLKNLYGLTAQDVISNLNYLISQKWVEERINPKTFKTPKGQVVSTSTRYFIITAEGIDKISGPSEFTPSKSNLIEINAIGHQNIITLGDGNQINIQFKELGEALIDLKNAIKSSSSIKEATKFEIIIDIDTIQSQLAKSKPNKSVVKTFWKNVKKVALAAGLVDATAKVAELIEKII